MHPKDVLKDGSTQDSKILMLRIASQKVLYLAASSGGRERVRQRQMYV